jgi:catalase
LSILLNGPSSFAGRKVGALVTDGVEAGILKALQAALKQEGAILKLVAPMVGGVVDSGGAWHEADEKIDGGPSVLFDAVAVLPSTEGATLLAAESTARDFVADAYAHMKFLAFTDAALPLLAKAGVPQGGDGGCFRLTAAGDVEPFLAACRALRFWEREAQVKQV